jgi:hypothetical protein
MQPIPAVALFSGRPNDVGRDAKSPPTKVHLPPVPPHNGAVSGPRRSSSRRDGSAIRAGRTRGYIGRKFVASKLWAPTAAGQFLAAHLKTLQEYPPRQAADTLSMKKAIEEAMRKMESPHGSSN